MRHDHVPPLTDSKSRSSSPALDPPRRRSCKYAFATSTSPSIFLAYRSFPHLGRTNHAPQRRQPTHSSASVALTHLRHAQTSIALGARGATACHFPRVPSLKAFGRRPPCKPHRCDRPASETLNTSSPRSRQSQSARTKFATPFSVLLSIPGYFAPGVALSQPVAAEWWHGGAQSRKCHLQSLVTDRATVAPSRR